MRQRLNLSRFKGMNLSISQHEENEFLRLINFKPTDNGPEMRNGGRAVFDYYDIEAIFIQKINDEQLIDGYNYNIDVDLYSASTDYLFDLYNWNMSSFISYLSLTLNVFKIIEDKGFAFTAQGEYLYYDSVAKEFYQSGYYPFDAGLPASTDTKYIYDTPYEGVYMGQDSNNDLRVLTYFPNFCILLKKATILDSESAFSIYEYSPSLKTTLGGCLIERATHPTLAQVDKFVTAVPVFISVDNDNKLRLAESTTTNAEFNLTFQKGKYELDKAAATGTPPAGKLATCQGNSLYYGSGKWFCKYDNTSAAVDSGGTVVNRVVSVANAGGGLVAVQVDTTTIKFYSDSGTAFTLVATYTTTGIVDFDLIYKEVSNGLTGLVVFMVHFGSYFGIVKYTAGTITSELLGETLKGKMDMSDYDHISAFHLFTNTSTFQKYYLKSSGVLFNEDEIAFFSFVFELNSGNFTIESWNLESIMNKQMAFPMSSGDIQSICFFRNSFTYEANRHLPVSQIPYFGIATNQTTVITVTTEPDYEFDLYVDPILKNSFVPLKTDDPTLFRPVDVTGGVYTLWNYWIVHIFPAPAIDTAVDALRLLKGSENSNGKYQLFSYSYLETSEEFIEKRFANTLSADNVILINFNEGQFIWKVDTETDYKLLNTQSYLGTATQSISTEIDTISATDFVMKYTQTKSVAADKAGFEKDNMFELTEGNTYVFSFYHHGVASKTLQVNIKDAVDTLLSENFTHDGTATWKYYSWKFTAPKTGPFKLIIKVATGEATSASAFYFKNFNFAYANLFNTPAVVSDWYYEKFCPTDIKYYTTICAMTDKDKDRLYLTAGGLFYIDKGNFQAIKSPMFLATNNYGIYLATERNQILFFKGYDVNTMSGSLILNEGCTESDRGSFIGSGNFAILYNDSSCFLFINDQVIDIGFSILTLLKENTTKYAAIDLMKNLICIPIDLDNLGDIDLVFDNTAKNIELGAAFAIYDLTRKSWYIYAYNSIAHNNNYVAYSDILKGFIVDFGTHGTYTQFGILEVTDDEMKALSWVNPESWDKMFGNITTREMSFNQDTASQKKLLSLTVDNLSKRGVPGDVPPVEKKTIDYSKINIYQKFNSFDDTQSIVKTIELKGIENKSYVAKINTNVYTSAIDISFARCADNENPKLILKDIYIEFQDIRILASGRKLDG
jgi:hypothetical protein